MKRRITFDSALAWRVPLKKGPRLLQYADISQDIRDEISKVTAEVDTELSSGGRFVEGSPAPQAYNEISISGVKPETMDR